MGKWEGTYDKETGGILTVKSELGEPIHKVATRGIKLWKEMDNTVFALPREKRGAWLQERKDYIIKRLNDDFQKPWFAAKADGTACDLGDMTYAEVASRMARMMYVAHEKRWIDPSLKRLTGDWLRRTEDRLSEVNDSSPKESAIQSYESLNDPQPFLKEFFAKYPAATTQILASEDIAYFLAICQRPGQKPCPFVAVLDNNFEVWFKKDSLWFSEDIEAVYDQDPQRVRSSRDRSQSSTAQRLTSRSERCLATSATTSSRTSSARSTVGTRARSRRSSTSPRRQRQRRLQRSRRRLRARVLRSTLPTAPGRMVATTLRLTSTRSTQSRAGRL